MNSPAKKSKKLDYKDLCKNATVAADNADIILGGMRWLTSPQAADIISTFDPKIKESLDGIRSMSVTPLRISEELTKSLDKFIEGPRCKHMARTSKKKEGINVMKKLFENMNNKKAYDSVCSITNTFEYLLSSLVDILGAILINRDFKSLIVSQGGSGALLNLKNVFNQSKKSLLFTKRINKAICVDLRKYMEYDLY